MSYCVNCGVELAPSEKNCPLCGVPVYNPAKPFDPDAPKPYPEHLDLPRAKSRLRKIVLLTALILLIPIVLCLYSDWKADGVVTWSLVVSGGEALLFLVMFTPFWFSRYRPLLCAVIDGVGTLVFVWVVDYASNGGWYWTLGFPLTAAAVAAVCIMAAVLSREGHVGFFIKTGTFLLLAGIYVPFVEYMLERSQSLPFSGWSLYAAAPCIIIAIVSFVLNASREVKDQLKRRFFI